MLVSLYPDCLKPKLFTGLKKSQKSRLLITLKNNSAPLSITWSVNKWDFFHHNQSSTCNYCSVHEVSVEFGGHVSFRQEGEGGRGRGWGGKGVFTSTTTATFSELLYSGWVGYWGWITKPMIIWELSSLYPSMTDVQTKPYLCKFGVKLANH